MKQYQQPILSILFFDDIITLSEDKPGFSFVNEAGMGDVVTW